MKGRRIARRLAVDVLYEAEIRDKLPLEAFDARSSDGWVVPAPDEALDAPEKDLEDSSSAALAYALQIIGGVQAHQADIDGIIVKYADHWALTRMPVVDKALLRIAVWELLWAGDIPIPVAINEAVELAKSLSTDDSGRFVNGLLGRVAEMETPHTPTPR